jgi:hypothetical protein
MSISQGLPAPNPQQGWDRLLGESIHQNCLRVAGRGKPLADLVSS